MKKIIYVLLVLSLITIPLSTEAFAITQEELEDGYKKIGPIINNLREMRGSLGLAITGTFSGIGLTLDQIQELKDRYVSEKAEAQSRFQGLP